MNNSTTPWGIDDTTEEDEDEDEDEDKDKEEDKDKDKDEDEGENEDEGEDEGDDEDKDENQHKDEDKDKDDDKNKSKRQRQRRKQKNVRIRNVETRPWNGEHFLPEQMRTAYDDFLISTQPTWFLNNQRYSAVSCIPCPEYVATVLWRTAAIYGAALIPFALLRNLYGNALGSPELPHSPNPLHFIKKASKKGARVHRATRCL